MVAQRQFGAREFSCHASQPGRGAALPDKSWRRKPEFREGVTDDRFSQGRVREGRVGLGVQRSAVPALELDQRGGVAPDDALHKGGIGQHW